MAEDVKMSDLLFTPEVVVQRYLAAAADMLTQPALKSVRIEAQSFDRDMIAMMLRLVAKDRASALYDPLTPLERELIEALKRVRPWAGVSTISRRAGVEVYLAMKAADDALAKAEAKEKGNG